MNSEQGTLLVAGALGMVGRAVLENLEGSGRRVVGLSRRQPDFETSARFLSPPHGIGAAARPML